MATNLDVLYPNVTDCFALEKQIKIIKNDMDFYYSKFNTGEGDRRKKLLKIKEEQFKVLQCPSKIEQKRQSDTMQIFDKNAMEAEKRIVESSKKTRNTLLSIAFATIIISFVLIKKIK